MQLHEIGQTVAKRRAELELTQAQIAKLSGLSRLTINQLESGKLNDLGVNKLIPLLGILGIDLTTMPRQGQKGLYKATISANVSYKGELTEALLSKTLATGDIPRDYTSQISVILDEVPLSVVIKAAEETAKSSGTSLRVIWKHLATWSKDMHLYRKVWI